MNKGIYKITNIINNKFYIGSAKNIVNRWYLHKIALENGKGNRYFQNAWNKYGINSFKLDIIELVQDESLLLEREQFYLDLLKPYDRNIGYNILKIAGSPLGTIMSAESKQKISDKLKGANHPLFGKRMSEETKQKIRNANLGKKQSKETIDKKILKTKGLKRSKKFCENLSEKLKNRKLSELHKENISKGKKGKSGWKQTEEQKKHLSELFKGKKHPLKHSDKFIKALIERNKNRKKNA
jgi:group I intron endonuclease